MIIGVISNYKEKRLSLARRLIKNHMERGRMVLPLLEVPYGADSHDSMRIENRALTHLIFKGYKHMVVVWSAPLMSMIEKRIKLLTDEIYLVDKREIWHYDVETQKCREVEMKFGELVASKQSEKRKKRK